MNIGVILDLLFKSEREILPTFRCKIFPTPQVVGWKNCPFLYD
jgi:hypothetical protein